MNDRITPNANVMIKSIASIRTSWIVQYCLSLPQRDCPDLLQICCKSDEKWLSVCLAIPSWSRRRCWWCRSWSPVLIMPLLCKSDLLRLPVWLAMRNASGYPLFFSDPFAKCIKTLGWVGGFTHLGKLSRKKRFPFPNSRRSWWQPGFWLIIMKINLNPSEPNINLILPTSFQLSVQL